MKRLIIIIYCCLGILSAQGNSPYYGKSNTQMPISSADYITGEDGIVRMYVNVWGHVKNPGTYLVYDVILFDAPPLLAVTDAYILTKYIQQFILVVRSGLTETDGLNRCLTQINQQNTQLSGVVMNAVDEHNTYGSGYYYNYYQAYTSEK